MVCGELDINYQECIYSVGGDQRGKEHISINFGR
jgi:hypothetical protein